MQVRCAVYTRVSTDNQAEVEFNSCQAQEEKIKSFINSQENLLVFKVYRDAGFVLDSKELRRHKRLRDYIEQLSERLEGYRKSEYPKCMEVFDVIGELGTRQEFEARIRGLMD